MTTSISINTTDTEYGTKKQKSVSYIDPDANSQSLIAFAQGMVSLMANTSYESTTKISRTECDKVSTEQTLNLAQVKFGSKTPIDMTLDEQDGIYKCTTPASQAAATVSIKVGGTVESTIIPTMQVKTSNTEFTGGNITLNWNNTWDMLKAYTNSPDAGEVYTWVVVLPETATFKETTFNFQCTITEG